MAMTAEQIRDFKAQNEAAIERAKAATLAEQKRAELQVHLRQEGKAAAQEEALRSEAKTIWVTQGGSPEAFEKRWADMYDDILYAKTVQALRGTHAERAAAHGHRPLEL